MRLTNVDEGDIVHLDVKGRRFYAHVATPPVGGRLGIRPLQSNVTYTSANSRQVIGIYRMAKGSA